MNDGAIGFVPALPLYASLPIILATFVALLPVLARLRGRATRYVLIAIWLRICADALQQFMIAKSPVGLSWNALISILLVAVGAMLIRPAMLRHKTFLPVAALILIGMAGGVLAGAAGDAVEATTRLLLLVVLAVAMAQALEENGDDVFLGLLMSVTPLFVLQSMSGLLGVVKASEGDGSASIIGGFAHEGGFSLCTLIALFIVVAAQRLRLSHRIVLIGICVVSLIFANYRTTILASLPLLFVGLVMWPVWTVREGQRGAMFMGVLVAMVVTLAVAVPQMAGRFEQGDSSSSLRELIHRPPEHFSIDDRRALSGRLYIWSRYAQGWRHAPGHAKIIGAGPGQRPEGLELYAHNSFFATLYESGVAGLIAFVAMIAGFFGLAFAAPRSERPALLAGQTSMLILHFGTMPLWNVEGIMLFALIIGACLHAAGQARRLRSGAAD